MDKKIKKYYFLTQKQQYVQTEFYQTFLVSHEETSKAVHSVTPHDFSETTGCSNTGGYRD